jgi:hypothetical protein
LDEILGNAVAEFDDTNESKKQAQPQDKDDEQTSFKRGVVALNDGEVLARNNERIPLNTKKTTLWCLNVCVANTIDVADRVTSVVPSADLLNLCRDLELYSWLIKCVLIQARLVDFVFHFFVPLGHKRGMSEGNIRRGEY